MFYQAVNGLVLFCLNPDTDSWCIAKTESYGLSFCRGVGVVYEGTGENAFEVFKQLVSLKRSE